MEEEEVEPLELSQLFVVSISNAEITRGGDIQDMLCPISIQDGAIDKKMISYSKSQRAICNFSGCENHWTAQLQNSFLDALNWPLSGAIEDKKEQSNLLFALKRCWTLDFQNVFFSANTTSAIKSEFSQVMYHTVTGNCTCSLIKLKLAF